VPLTITNIEINGIQIHKPEYNDDINEGKALRMAGTIPINTETSIKNSFSVNPENKFA
jgi:hypothetical protein